MPREARRYDVLLDIGHPRKGLPPARFDFVIISAYTCSRWHCFNIGLITYHNTMYGGIMMKKSLKSLKDEVEEERRKAYMKRFGKLQAQKEENKILKEFN